MAEREPRQHQSFNPRLESDEVVDQEFFARSPEELMTALKKESSGATRSTLVESSAGSTSNVHCDAIESTCIWSEMVHRSADVWDDRNVFVCDGNLETPPKCSCCDVIQRMTHCVIYEFHHVLRTLCDSPYILISGLCLFFILSVVAVMGVNLISHNVTLDKKSAAKLKAQETGIFFADQLSNAILPLYALQQAVTYSDYFKNLTLQIGEYRAEGSAPITRGPKHADVYDYRDVSGICDDVYVNDKFHEIVTSIQNNFELHGIVVNYRLAPNNVFCLAEPLVNFEDFGPDKLLNSTPDIGWDLLNTPDSEWTQTLVNTYNPSVNPIYTRGPEEFNKGDLDLDKGDLNTPELFYAHLAVDIPGYPIEIDGTTFNSWGFVMSIIDWSKVKERSEIFKQSQREDIDFYLYRNDTKLVTIARSDNWEDLTEENSVEVPVHTVNGEWINRFGHRDGFTPHWHIPGVVASMFLAFVLSIMFMMILVERKLYKQLLSKVVPQSAMRKIHRGQTVVERFNLVTVFFSSVVALSGEMKPNQVMDLLNELYASFDKIVEKYGVYKVETIGDTYMVVGGAPNRIPASEAAEKIALFALEATEFVKDFKTSMGGQVSIRVGIASGSAVAGVIGKSMPRYCFFGDTVNSASRMESTSMAMRIQCSDSTLRLLDDAPNYVFNAEERTEISTCGVDVKGKGLMNTWWIHGTTKIVAATNIDVEFGQDLNIRRASKDISTSGLDEYEFLPTVASSDTSRYHVSQRTYIQFKALSGQAWSVLGKDEGVLVAAAACRDTMIDRIASMLEIRLSALMQARNQVPFDDITKKELRAYVAHIESLYNDVEYHRFEHASHVAISMNKLLDFEKTPTSQDRRKIDWEMSQDPFISFMLVYSALVHDVGHTGKSNKILQDQNEELFKNSPTPLAEQLSISLAFATLERKEFSKFRAAIIPTTEDRIEFAKVLFCAILCTDVASPDRLKLVKDRFDAVIPSNEISSSDQIHAPPTSRQNAICDHTSSQKFPECLSPFISCRKDICRVLSLSCDDMTKNQQRFIITENRMQKYVSIEHLMQVADVAHCMQGWENFIKWNYRLYKEFMDCYKKNLISEPSGSWAAGQIGFINNYILPLAQRTEKCCGLAANLNLVQLAKDNRSRWEKEGQFITDIFISADKNGDDENTVWGKCFATKSTC